MKLRILTPAVAAV